MVNGRLVPVSRLEWDGTFNTNANDRDLRAFSRDPHTRYLYLLNKMESLEREENLKAIE
jgi:hypothetical protein